MVVDVDSGMERSFSDCKVSESKSTGMLFYVVNWFHVRHRV